MTPIMIAALALTQPQAAPVSPELQPLAFLVGSCWRAALGDGQGTDTHCFTPVFGGRFVRDRHTLTGVSYSGETLYRWDATARQIRLDYYSSMGMFMSGTSSAAADGLSFELSYLSPQGATVTVRAAWTRAGPDAYVVTTEVRDGDGWRVAGERPRFERVGPAPAD